MDHAEWMARAARGDDLEPLLESLFEGTVQQVGQRVLLLTKRAPDPRVASALAAAVRKPPFTSTGSLPVIWTPLFGLLARIGDAETLRELTPLADGYPQTIGAAAAGKAMQAKLKKLLAALEKKHGPAKPAARAEKARATRSSADALLEEVLAAPDDDRPRAVLADWLQERGDPRGELIALQLRRARGEAGDPEREAALLAAHKKEWLGAVASVVDVDSAQFARGFLDSVTVNGHPAAKVAATAGDPIWGTVRMLACTHPKPKPLAVICHPVMRALRRVTRLDPKAFYHLGESKRVLPIEEIEILWAEEIRGRKALIRAWSEAPGLSALKHLEVGDMKESPEGLGFFWRSALGQRLESVVLGVIDAPGWVADVLGRSLSRPRSVVLGQYYAITASKEDGPLDQLSIRYAGDGGDYVPHMIVRTIECLPAGKLAKLTVDAPSVEQDPELAARLATARRGHLAGSAP